MQEMAARAESMLNWDVANGVARRSWSGNAMAREAIERTQLRLEGFKVTLPYQLEDAGVLEGLF